jgi:hypothetical protein
MPSFKICLFFLLSISITDVLLAQDNLDSLPVVFTVGEYGKQYEQLVMDCETHLIELTDQSMDSAYVYWLDLMKQLEFHADTSGFDIKGVKIWINIFWNPNGTMRHIVFFPKKSSRNIDFDKLKLVLERFARKFKIIARYKDCFSHFGSASFPTHADYLLNRK